MSDIGDIGFPDYFGYVTVTTDSTIGMLVVRGDLSSKSFKDALEFDLPEICGIKHYKEVSIAWMSPDELLFLCPKKETIGLISTLQRTLKNHHSLVVDVSDARSVFTLQGGKVREVIAKLAPVDVAPSQFGPGQIRRTRFGQIAAAFWMVSEEEVKIICFRSFGHYMYQQLCISSSEGSELDLWC